VRRYPPDTSKPVAVLVLVVLLVVLVLVVASASRGERRDGHRRVIGHGQVRFDDAGPERWAARWRRQRRTVERLRGHLSAELERLVWLTSAFQCIHAHEGAWYANTGNGYYGGLQMDLDFQRAYGPELLRAKGTADHWTPAEQISVAIVAHAQRGFQPWPNTARMCGLL
jgi:hypothetical protein